MNLPAPPKKFPDQAEKKIPARARKKSLRKRNLGKSFEIAAPTRSATAGPALIPQKNSLPNFLDCTADTKSGRSPSRILVTGEGALHSLPSACDAARPGGGELGSSAAKSRTGFQGGNGFAHAQAGLERPRLIAPIVAGLAAALSPAWRKVATRTG
jgi:hypothetical protein